MSGRDPLSQVLRPNGMKLLQVLPLLLLTACSAGGEDSLAAVKPADSRLTVQVDLGDGTAPQRWVLSCPPTSETTHPDADAACAAIEQLEEPFVPLPEDRVCTEIYGGPQEALVSGSWKGAKVELTVLRSDGCAIAQWDSLVPLLPVPS